MRKNRIFNPSDIALNALAQNDFSIEALFTYRYLSNGERSSAPPYLNVKELDKLKTLPNYDEIKKNALETYARMKRIHKSGGEPDYEANLKNTITGTVTTHVIDQFTEAQAKLIRIRWLPSSAEHPDNFHMRFYGKTMSLYRARHLGLGNSKYAHQRGYGCQCGCNILSNLTLVNKEDQYR